jgi:ribose-phosphate pyrophosphokinase
VRVLVLSLPGMERLSARLAAALGAPMGTLVVHRFPDGECRVRIDQAVRDKVVVIVARLDHPEDKLLPLLFGAETARDLGADSVGLVAPYLAYMRQDRRFHAGEGISARYFAGILDRTADWLVTVDPHLHRIRKLEELLTIPAQSVHAAPLMADWVRVHIEKPMLIGPDSESMQWVRALATLLEVPHAVLSKRRSDDRTVELRLPDLSACVGHQPVLVDDIIASGGTMLEATRLLRRAGWPPPACLAVHAVFAGNAYEALQAAGVTSIATCNTIPHLTNAIDVSELLAAAVTQRLEAAGLAAPSLEAAR